MIELQTGKMLVLFLGIGDGLHAEQLTDHRCSEEREFQVSSTLQHPFLFS